MHIAAATEINSRLLPKLKQLHTTLHAKVIPSSFITPSPQNWFSLSEKTQVSGLSLHVSNHGLIGFEIWLVQLKKFVLQLKIGQKLVNFFSI